MPWFLEHSTQQIRHGVAFETQFLFTTSRNHNNPGTTVGRGNYGNQPDLNVSFSNLGLQLSAIHLASASNSSRIELISVKMSMWLLISQLRSSVVPRG